ncbi:MAG TPA: alcohol dehydrogenase catalytic domain-containing protein [Steroidobacteraceae bacterium]|nr:alcohol dehydrogenase catalytic domain-containing protein [Steroidobacteraceae bacterium]
MRAVVYEGAGKVAIREVAKPTLEDPGDAIVRVTLAGICATDLHAVAGHFPGMTPGAVVGHEFVGDIVALGSSVTRLRVGDHVMASDFCACGYCHWCARGDHWECPERAFFGTGSSFGPVLSGAQAQFVRVPHAETTLAAVPAGCSDEAAILIGDNLATGWAAIERAAVRPGETVAILGGGAVGQLASLSAQIVGAGAVLVIEPNAHRRALAQVNGALAAAPPAATDVIGKLSRGDGADVVVEATGSTGPLRDAFDLVRKRGRIVSVGAHSSEEWPLPLARSFARELTLTFAIGDSIRLRRQLSGLVIAGILEPTVVVDARIGLGATVQAYADLREQKIMKALVDPWI